MTKILLTGMSGTGKSSALHMLAERGYRTIDTDTEQWSHWITTAEGQDWVWREDAIAELLDTHSLDEQLYIAGCKSNQEKFYSYFDHIVLLSAPMDILLDRIESRTNNNYGKSVAERAKVIEHIQYIEPLLRATATIEIDTSIALEQLVDILEKLQ